MAMLYSPSICALLALLLNGNPTGTTHEVPPALPFEGGYDDGFFIRSRDTDAEFKVSGLLQFMAVANDLRREPQTEFDMKRIRPEFSGRFLERFRFNIEPNFGADEVELEEAWLGMELNRNKDMLRVGRMKSPFGLEEVRSRRHIPFTQFSILNQFSPAEQHGLFLSGETRLVEWGLALTNGNGGQENGDGKEIAVRTMFHPYRDHGARSMRNLQIGLAGTFAREDRSIEGTTLRNAGRQTFATYAPGARMDGSHTRVGLEAAWFHGPTMLQAEVLFDRRSLTLGTGKGHFDTFGTYISAQHVLSGEELSFSGPSIEGKRKGTWVAAARASYLDLDPLLRESGMIGAGEGTAGVTSVWAGLNYYFNEHVILRNNLVYSFYAGEIEVDGHSISSEPRLMFELQMHF